ncbi:MAG: DUF4388 domain-containing protein [Thermodesulfovibrionales bacterium]
MAFTGDLEQLHIVDIIQLLNTTRKSGTLSVRGQRGESRIIFSNGYIVGASHLNNKVRIGTVLVKMNLLSLEDLQLALELQKSAGQERKPLISTLIDMGRLGHDSAAKGLRKLIEITLVELVGWTSGTFTLDPDAISVSPDCSYYADKMEQEISLDAQMLLMDTLRVFDERQRDLQSGDTVTPDEELYADLIASEPSAPDGGKKTALTADDLGLGDLDQLERKIPQFQPATEVFDPSEIHRQMINETLSGFPEQEREAFVSFLNKSTRIRSSLDNPQKQEVRTRAIVLLSGDELFKHSLMTICKDEGLLVFTTGSEEELDLLIDQCLKLKAITCLAFDVPASEGETVSVEKFPALRRKIKDTYPEVTLVQMASQGDSSFALASYAGGARAVFPKPAARATNAAFIREMITLLGTLKFYMHAFFGEEKTQPPDAADTRLTELKNVMTAMAAADEPSAVLLSLLQYLSGICSRCITFFVRQNELAGDKALGVYAEKSEGPTSVKSLKITLSEPSVFSRAVQEMHCYHGEGGGRPLSGLFEAIGEPLSPAIVLIPVASRGKTAVLVYGDFGKGEAPDLNADFLEILAEAAGLAVEKALYRKQRSKNP